MRHPSFGTKWWYSHYPSTTCISGIMLMPGIGVVQVWCVSIGPH